MSRLVFITGASSGIGQALAWQFYQAGYSLALVARRTAQIQSWIDERDIAPERCRVYGADVSITDHIVAAGQDCLESQGLPDVVIACAGISVGVDTAEPQDIEIIARTFAINNTGTAATFHPFVRAMVKRGSGVLVGISSVNGIRGFPNNLTNFTVSTGGSGGTGPGSRSHPANPIKRGINPESNSVKNFSPIPYFFILQPLPG